MANNYLITGYWGEPHVTAENDRGINAAIFGTGRFVLPVGEQFKAEYIGNNTIRMYDGKLMDNGAAAGIPVGEYVDLLIANAGSGKKRNDLIVFQYSKDSSTLIESGTFVVVQGEETSGTAADPALTQEDLLSDEAVLDQFALWRITVSGTTIAAPVKVFSAATANQADTNAHISNTNNPHGVTTKQIGASPAIESTTHSGCYYRKVNGETEWINPPMELDETYRTTERYQGKPVYTKLIDCGELPNATSKNVSTGVSLTTHSFIDLKVFASWESSGMAMNGVLPLFTTTNGLVARAQFASTSIQIVTTTDRSTTTAYAVIKYVEK